MNRVLAWICSGLVFSGLYALYSGNPLNAGIAFAALFPITYFAKSLH